MYIKEKQKLNFERKSKLIKRATKSEMKMKSILDENKIRYMFQKGFIAGNGFYIVDFYLPKPYKIVIEVDGKYHETPKQKEYDKRKDLYLINRGFKVIRVKNEDVDTFNILNHLM